MTMAIGVPSAIKTFNWLGTMWGGRIRFTSPMLFAIGFVSLFVSGGISGPFLAQPVLDIQLHDTYFVIGHFHLIMGVASIFGIFGSDVLLVPQDVRANDERKPGALAFLVHLHRHVRHLHAHALSRHGRASAALFAVHGTATISHGLVPLQQFITYAAFVTIAGQFIFLFNLFWSMKAGKKASDNPWEATTLEWTTTTPPPHDNFGGHTPVVYNGPYEYSVPGAPRDYVMQTDPAIVPVAH